LAEVYELDTAKNATVMNYWYEIEGRYQRYRNETFMLLRTSTTDDRLKRARNRKAVGIPWKKKIQGLAMKSCSKECR
jgi:hypothetical protein